MSRIAPILVAICLALGLSAPSPATGQAAPDKPTATIDVLDVGQGASILIRSPEGKAALVDAGPSNRVVKLLKHRGVTSLDLVVVSHQHQDHYCGMAEVIVPFVYRTDT